MKQKEIETLDAAQVSLCDALALLESAKRNLDDLDRVSDVFCAFLRSKDATKKLDSLAKMMNGE